VPATPLSGEAVILSPETLSIRSITMVYVVGGGGGVGVGVELDEDIFAGFELCLNDDELLDVEFGVELDEDISSELELCFKSNDDELLRVELCVGLVEDIPSELELCIDKYMSSLSGKTMVSIPSATQL